MTNPIGRIIYPRRGTFVQPLWPCDLMKGQEIRQRESFRYIFENVQGLKPGGRSIFFDCKTLPEFEAKIREALVFLTSDTGLHDRRMTSSTPSFRVTFGISGESITYSAMPPERVYIELRGGTPGIPGDFYDIVIASVETKRIIYIPNKESREIFCSGKDKRDGKIYSSFLEAFWLKPDKIKDLFCPSVIVFPLNNIAGQQPEVMGVAVVAGLREDFLDPRVDFSPLRAFCEYTGEMLARSGLIR